MSELDDYINDLNKLVLNLDDIILKILSNNEGKILGKVKLRLFNTGIDGSGKKIVPNYSENTKQRKKQNNQRTSHVTLRDSGELYSSLFLEYSSRLKSIFINTYSDKALSLIEKYGEDIFGFTKNEQDWIILFIIEPEINKILNSINNKNIEL